MLILLRTPPANGGPSEAIVIPTATMPTLLERDPDQACALIREELGEHLDGKDIEAGLGDLDEDDDPEEPVT